MEMTELLEARAASFGLHADDYRAAVGRARLYDDGGSVRVLFDYDGAEGPGSLDTVDVWLEDGTPCVTVQLAGGGHLEQHLAEWAAWDLLVAVDLRRTGAVGSRSAG